MILQAVAFIISLSLVLLIHFSFSYCFLYFFLLWYLLISLSLSLTVSYFYFSCVTNVLFSLSFTVLFPCFRSVVLLTHLSFSRCFLFLFLFKGQFHKISYPIFGFKNATMGPLWTILIRRFFNCAEIRFNTVQYLQRVGRHSCWAWWHCLRVVAFDYRRTMWPLHKDCKFLSCSLSLTYSNKKQSGNIMYRIIGCAKLNSNKWKIRGQWTCLREYETFLENLLSLFMKRFRSSVLSKNIGVNLTHGFLLSLVLLSYCFPFVTTGVIPCKDSSSSSTQGWEFAHFISERIFCFLSKNERTSDSLKKMGDSLIHSFLVSEMSNSLTWLIMSDLSESLMVAHFWCAKWAIRSLL